MRSISTLIITTLALLFASNAVAEGTQENITKIKDVIQSAYVEGVQNEGNLEKIDRGFHPDFAMLGIGDNGSMWKFSIEEWKKRIVKSVSDGKLPRPADDKVSVKFLSVDVTGNAAVAKLEYYVGTKLEYIDYISLYKFDGDWKLVSKIFHKTES
ncbi:MAG: nuclear transport factor 2 family protein [Pseudomonadota bacterium]